MKRFLGLLLAAVCALSASSAAQCATFDIATQPDPSGTFQTVTLDVSGSLPLAPTFLVAGETPGSLSITLLGQSLELGILPPLLVSGIGSTDATGSLSTSFDLPPDLGLTLFAQSLSVGLGFGTGGIELSFCESNVDSVVL